MRGFRKLCGAALIAGFMLPQIALGSGSEAEAASGKWKQDKKGWYYSYSDGSYAKNTWLKIGGKWYYFGANGYMVKSWKQIGTKWYFFGTDGKMRTGWQKVGKKWYFFGSNGVMKTGWIKVGSEWYYLNENGIMLTGWQTISDKLYHFDASGRMEHDTVVDQYKLGSDGAWVGHEDDDAFGNFNVKEGWCEVYTDTGLFTVKGIDIRSHKEHNYYSHETDEQAIKADAICKMYADDIMNAPEFETDLDRVQAAATVVAYYSNQAEYGADDAKHYRSPYGVFISQNYTCAGSTRALGRILDYMGFEWKHANENLNEHQWCVLTIDGHAVIADGMAGLAYYSD